MKVGNTINGLTITDVKQVNKLNLIQFLKEVDSYLQQGYQIDVKSGRQVGLVLQCKMFKTEHPFGSIAVGSTDVGSVGEQIPAESVASLEAEPTPEPQSTNVEEGTVEPVEEVVKEEAPVAPKKTATRSKKTT